MNKIKKFNKQWKTYYKSKFKKDMEWRCKNINLFQFIDKNFLIYFFHDNYINDWLILYLQ